MLYGIFLKQLSIPRPTEKVPSESAEALILRQFSKVEILRPPTNSPPRTTALSSFFSHLAKSYHKVRGIIRKGF